MTTVKNTYDGYLDRENPEWAKAYERMHRLLHRSAANHAGPHVFFRILTNSVVLSGLPGPVTFRIVKSKSKRRCTPSASLARLPTALTSPALCFVHIPEHCCITMTFERLEAFLTQLLNREIKSVKVSSKYLRNKVSVLVRKPERISNLQARLLSGEDTSEVE